ncbi:cupin domain-containing protein [Streptomyces sp. NBC_01803]|uniref:cupin domain-containing protein n=1 Tax=Streptomyces sp. NBC_01803 TaxID=2975946 RepID=UPI002DDC5B09|nr:cupin domain-containing protein [Streptomyces sp. NBC_01803]WSA45844.1 cupin domain-containing protein [Streptomyces sp. NBC_01803]
MTTRNDGPARPVDLYAALDTFDEIFDPRVATRVNDYDVRIGKVRGDYVWHTHQHTDEFFLVLDGELTIGLRENGAERTVTLSRGAVFTVPRGTEHRPSSADGAAILMFEPTGTVTTGDDGDTAAALPGHIRPRTGRALAE